MRDGSTSTSTTTVTTGSSGSGSGSRSRGVGIGPSPSAGRRRNGSAVRKNESRDQVNDHDHGDINGTCPDASTSKPSRPSLRRKRSSSESSIVALEAPPEGMVGLAGKRRKVNVNGNGQVNGQVDRKGNGRVNGKGKGRATSADLDRDMDGVERGIDVDVDVDLSLDEDDLEIGGGKRRVRRAKYGEVGDEEGTGHAEGNDDGDGDEQGERGINGIPEESLLASFREYTSARVFLIVPSWIVSSEGVELMERLLNGFRRMPDLPSTAYSSRLDPLWTRQ